MYRAILCLCLLSCSGLAWAEAQASISVSNIRYALEHIGQGPPVAFEFRPSEEQFGMWGNVSDAAYAPGTWRHQYRPDYGAMGDAMGGSAEYTVNAPARGGSYQSTVAARSDGVSAGHASAIVDDRDFVSFVSGSSTRVIYYADVHVQARIDPGVATEEIISGYVSLHGWEPVGPPLPWERKNFQIDYSSVGGTNSDTLWIDETFTLALIFPPGAYAHLALRTELYAGSAMAVPEPAMWSLLLPGLVLLAWGRRRTGAPA